MDGGKEGREGAYREPLLALCRPLSKEGGRCDHHDFLDVAAAAAAAAAGALRVGGLLGQEPD